MRVLLATSALLVLMGVSPSNAREYPWCTETSASGFNPSCSFATKQQCMATLSGQAGDCIVNPIVAFGQAGVGVDTSVRSRRAPRDDNQNMR